MRQWPSPQDPGYRSEAYQLLKQQEAERMFDQIEQHCPGFRQDVRTLMVGTPTTIERYLLKNGGAMGGPKSAIGQEMLSEANTPRPWLSARGAKHLHALPDVQRVLTSPGSYGA